MNDVEADAGANDVPNEAGLTAAVVVEGNNSIISRLRAADSFEMSVGSANGYAHKL